MASASLSSKMIKDVCSDPSVIISEPRSINGLPDEILLNILSYFGPEELCFIIAPVCERWNNLAKDVKLWKPLSYNCRLFSKFTDIKEVLTNAPALHSLIIRDRDLDAHEILEILIEKRVELRRLIIMCERITFDYDLFATIVDLYPDLEVLSLEGCCSIADPCFGLITRLKNLSELYLYNCKLLSGKTVRHIADSYQNLKKLSLGGRSEIFDEDVIHVIDRLGKQLTSFLLGLEYLTDVAYSYLKKCARLQKLDLFYCDNMRNRGLLEGIGSLQELTSLRLHFHWIDRMTAQAFCTFFHRTSMTSIVLLELGRCFNLDDEGLKVIAERCIHLKELAVCGDCNVTDAGVSILISHCNQLRVLRLMRITYVTGQGWLTRVPSHLPQLRELSLVGCYSLCDKYAKELMAAVPELEFHT